jgi:hypothetical protein
MIFKSTLAGTMVTLVALALSAIGCGSGDECNIAAEHLVDCLNPAGSPSSAAPSATAKCDGSTACIAACVNRTDCAALQDAWAATASAGSKAFNSCVSGCKAP